MPRIKSSGQVEALERQRKELDAKLKEAKAEARAAGREKRIESAKIAGTAFLDELEADPTSEAARALLALLDRRLGRSADRARFGLGEPPVAVRSGTSSSSLDKAAAAEG